jgi:hypothetical protein
MTKSQRKMTTMNKYELAFVFIFYNYSLLVFQVLPAQGGDVLWMRGGRKPLNILTA